MFAQCCAFGKVSKVLKGSTKKMRRKNKEQNVADMKKERNC